MCVCEHRLETLKLELTDCCELPDVGAGNYLPCLLREH